MKFTKMQGAGNDYVYVDCFRERIAEPGKLARRISDRHFGVGSDGLVLIGPSGSADFKMEIYNADGSAAGMCGNGIRCLGKYVYEHGLTRKTRLTVETRGGPRLLELGVKGDTVEQVRVDMGAPGLEAHGIPILSEKDLVLDEAISAGGATYRMTGVSMGNPHAVVFVDDVAHFPVAEVGPCFECHPRFPERINAEFCQVEDRGTLRMRVWERGSGETLACGTGACAAVVASVLNDLTDGTVIVKLLGGDLLIEWDRGADRVYMTGPAVTVFEGELPE